ncbi:MAG: DUF309 domain-containing protein [Cyanothece sp. SIO2G6]|nr:DUF309 domain-containing protein [Cyanothece sp. SIO2G6]
MVASDDQATPAEFWLGVEQFNQGEFYACHDTLEAIWMEAMEPDRTFYQGILQIAVGLYHLGNLNWQGCVTLLGEGIRRLQPYQPDYAAIAITPFVESTQILLRSLQQAGPERVSAIAHHVYACYPHATAIEPETVTEIEVETVTEVPQDGWRSPLITRIIESDSKN